MNDIFHKAARDGNLSVLRRATKRDCNRGDDDGVTPTAFAAHEGNLDALRLLVGRGGDPERSDNFGNTSLHCAAARGHMSCVSFLVNFGVNLWAVDADLHSAKDLASLNDHHEILRYLDSAITKQAKEDPKRAKRLEDKSRKEAEKRRKEIDKKLDKIEKRWLVEEAKIHKERENEEKSKKNNKDMKSIFGTISKKSVELTMSLTGGRIPTKLIHTADQNPPKVIRSIGRNPPRIIHSKSLNPPTKFSELTQNTRNRATFSSIPRKILPDKLFGGPPRKNAHFKAVDGEIEGKRSLRSIENGVQRDSEIIFAPSDSMRALDHLPSNAQKRGKLSDVFHTKSVSGVPRFGLSRALSEPDFSEHFFIPEKPSLFDRPGFGSVAFRSSVSTTLKALQERKICDIDALSLDSHGSPLETRLNTLEEEEDSLFDDMDISGEPSLDNSSIYNFLNELGLDSFYSVFVREQIDLDALMLLNEQDLETLEIPLGPKKKILRALNDRRLSLEPDSEVNWAKL